ncbi:hypothetical protein [uncultured Paludibaculum sp.]|uniref:MutS-related protein n=1 Tax=uncultured Paludibaculum sp. TaxID=1765020 RepID=UPI002AAA966D|nr:hypothetical protein [uncultured Paludibaculum sp.]
MDGSPILAEYQTKQQEAEGALAAVRNRQGSALTALLGTTVLLLALGWMAWKEKAVPAWYPILLLPVVAYCARRYTSGHAEERAATRLLDWRASGLARLNGEWVGQGYDGTEFDNADHVFQRDLDLFGQGSLFELLATARTSIGRRRLAEYLTQHVPLEESVQRQEAVRELRPMVELREKIGLLGRFETQESKRETFDKWFAMPVMKAPVAVRLVALVSTSACVISALLGLAMVLPWSLVVLILMICVPVNCGLALAYQPDVRRTVEALQPVGVEISVFREGLALLQHSEFQSAKLGAIVRTLREAGASGSIRRIERMIVWLNERNKDWFYGPSMFLLYATQMTLAIEHWRGSHQENMRAWLDDWAEFEALNALAGYGYEHPEDPFPELVVDGPAFVGEDLGHPLLDEETCVRNDVALPGPGSFYVVSGSNMAGKSTFLRTIGVNSVLAMAGAPVRARRLRLSGLRVCASISVGDSLLNRKSKFLAEVERLKLTLEYARAGEPVLFLIDEIFSGTNSHDRGIAAAAVVKTLTECGAIGALSTHDLALTAMADETLGRNVHMGSRNGTDPMDFDYLVKPGITKESNALAIARMAGVPI